MKTVRICFVQGEVVYKDEDKHYDWGLIRNHLTIEEYVELVDPWEFERPSNQSDIEYNMSMVLNEDVKTMYRMIDDYHERLDEIHMMIDELGEYRDNVMRPHYFEISRVYSDLDDLNDEFSDVAIIDGLDWRKTPLIRDR